MGNLKNQENSSNSNFKKDEQRLQAIRALLKLDDCWELARELLDSIQADLLHPKNKVLFLYLNGRYHSHLYKRNKDIEDLEWSNDYYDQMAHFAYEYNVRLKDIRFHFGRAFTKFQMINAIWDEDRKPKLFQKANKIATNILDRYPDNASFIWLKKELQHLSY